LKKIYVPLMATLLFMLWNSQTYGNMAPVPPRGTVGHYFLHLFALTPRELFAIVGALLGILEGIFITALVRTRQKCK
jgi:hypothetical protein